ncbi:MAG: substrate-binding domain-containing protein [Nitrospirales bacterium]|nr:substrate-binding domain-containing protein [Nitrospira sp.]MDR4502493.1 substrate-binding domain-containing protein [Nitrospirales bacterium]
MKQILSILIILLFFSLLGSHPLLAEDGPPDHSELAGTLLISGNGPEQHLIASLGEAFEEIHPLASVDVFWHENAKPIRMLELKETHIGVTGQVSPHLRSTVVARDGIAIVTNFSNPVSEMSVQQLADVFSGHTRFWSQVYEEAPEMKITLINRSDNQNIRQGFLEVLGIKRIARSAKVIAQERHAINAVTGDLAAIAFVSITPALRAKEDGVAINLVFVDKVEPEYQTVLDKTYPVQRPIVFHTDTNPMPLTLAFEQFTLSPEGQRIIKMNKYYPLATE